MVFCGGVIIRLVEAVVSASDTLWYPCLVAVS